MTLNVFILMGIFNQKLFAERQSWQKQQRRCLCEQPQARCRRVAEVDARCVSQASCCPHVLTDVLVWAFETEVADECLKGDAVFILKQCWLVIFKYPKQKDHNSY